MGHIFPVFLRFRGGKGVATAVGVLLGLNIWVGLMAIATWLLTAIFSRISSLSAIVAAILAPIYMVSISESTDYFLAVLIMSMILIWRHQSNIVNLLSGKEQRIGDQKSSQK